MTTNDTNIEKSVSQLKRSGEIVTVQVVNDLKEIHRALSKDPELAGKTKPFVVIYGMEGKNAVILYPQISSSRVFLASSKRIEIEDLELALDDAEIVGNTERPSFRARLEEERSTLIAACCLFLLLSVVMITASSSIASEYLDYLSNPDAFQAVGNFVSFYQTIGEALLTVLTLFLTVFVLFTITQNSALATDENLFKTGQTHKFARDDKYVSLMLGVSLIFSLLGLIITVFPHDLQLLLSSYNKINLIIPLLYSGAFTGLFICFTSLTYYARRVLIANESNLVKNIISERLRKK